MKEEEKKDRRVENGLNEIDHIFKHDVCITFILYYTLYTHMYNFAVIRWGLN